MGKLLVVKVKEKNQKDFEYKNKIDISNPVLLALVFSDLEREFHAPVEKAFRILLTSNKKVFPI